MEVLLTGLCQGEIPDSRVVVLYVPVVTETKVRDRLRGNRFPSGHDRLEERKRVWI